jgi:chitin synthase
MVSGTAVYTDRLQPQPTYEVTGMPNSLGHNESYEDVHRMGYTPDPFQQEAHQGSGQYQLSPSTGHQNHYFDQPYGSDISDQAHGGIPQPAVEAGQQFWQDDMDDRPMLRPGDSYGPDPYNVENFDQSHSDLEAGFPDAPPPATNAPIRRWKTVKEVQLFNGNLVLDCPIPLRLLKQIEHAQPPERDEFTHMRYSAATCDPSEFRDKRFTLRQRLFAEPRHTELFIVVTMYNEEDELFARTMIGVIKNIEYMNSCTGSKTWGKNAWRKIVVCVVSDGRAKINPRTRAVLAAIGVY